MIENDPSFIYVFV